MPEQTPDLMIKFRTTMKKKNSKGGDWLGLYLTIEEAQSLYNEIGRCLAGPNGVNLQIHSNEKTAEGGRKFLSSICFVRETQARPQTGQQGEWKPVPARQPQSPQTRQNVQTALGYPQQTQANPVQPTGYGTAQQPVTRGPAPGVRNYATQGGNRPPPPPAQSDFAPPEEDQIPF